VYIAAAVVLTLGGLYSLMWMISSASLACGYCNCTYSLFAESFRCRQPDLALVLAVLLFASAWLFGRAARRMRRAPELRSADDSHGSGNAA
jgi:hypothetical protein